MKNRIPATKKKSRNSQMNVVKFVPKPSVGYHYIDQTVTSLHDLQHDFLLAMLKQLKVMCTLSWDEISKYKGLGWDKIPQSNMKFRIPPTVGMDSLYHIKVSRGGRIWGYREGDVFQLVWFDPFHKVTPE